MYTYIYVFIYIYNLYIYIDYRFNIYLCITYNFHEASTYLDPQTKFEIPCKEVEVGFSAGFCSWPGF